MEKMDWAKRSVMVTGGCGFIGRHLVRRLVGAGCRVRVLDCAAEGIVKGQNLEVINDSVLNIPALEYALGGCHVCFHLAGVRFPANCLAHHDINATGTLRVLQTCYEKKISKVVTISEVVGPTEKNPIPLYDDYHASRHTAEMYTLHYSRHYGLPTVCLRLSDIFGPEQREVLEYIVPHLVKLMMSNRDAVIYTPPRYSRDFCYVDNVVDALLLAAQANVSGEIINVGLGESQTLRMLAQTVKRLVPGAFIPRIEVKDVECPWCFKGKINIAKAANVLGYKPRVSFETGLRKYISSLRPVKCDFPNDADPIE